MSHAISLTHAALARPPNPGENQSSPVGSSRTGAAPPSGARPAPPLPRPPAPPPKPTSPKCSPQGASAASQLACPCPPPSAFCGCGQTVPHPLKGQRAPWPSPDPTTGCPASSGLPQIWVHFLSSSSLSIPIKAAFGPHTRRGPPASWDTHTCLCLQPRPGSAGQAAPPPECPALHPSPRPPVRQQELWGASVVENPQGLPVSASASDQTRLRSHCHHGCSKDGSSSPQWPENGHGAQLQGQRLGPRPCVCSAPSRW